MYALSFVSGNWVRNSILPFCQHRHGLHFAIAMLPPVSALPLLVQLSPHQHPWCCQTCRRDSSNSLTLSSRSSPAVCGRRNQLSLVEYCHLRTTCRVPCHFRTTPFPNSPSLNRLPTPGTHSCDSGLHASDADCSSTCRGTSDRGSTLAITNDPVDGDGVFDCALIIERVLTRASVVDLGFTGMRSLLASSCLG